jgi:O-acetyl-ADP-ribose deacetylase (regulator of RNase III)
MRTEIRASGRVLRIVRGDITTIPADAIVNAANSALAGGGGVDGAIHRAGGSGIMSELRRDHPDGCTTGDAVATGAGRLPARWVIHAVGPVWHGGGEGEPALLASAYRSALSRADALGARTVTLPAISAGVYGYPLEEAARIAVSTVTASLAGSRAVEEATFVLFSDDTLAAFGRALAESAELLVVARRDRAGRANA